MRYGLLVTVLLGVLSVSPAWAEDLYIGQSTAGLADGSSCANQLAATFFNTASNWTSGAGKISAGDTAHLCGTITSTMTAKADGTAGNSITIKFETGANITQTVCSNVTACLNISNRSYIIVDGGTNGYIANSANGSASAGYASQSASIGMYADPCSHCEIKNLIIKNIYVHAVDLADKAISVASTAPCLIVSGSNTTIHNNTLFDCGWAIFHRFRLADSFVEIYSNEIYHVDHGWAVAGGVVNAVGTDFSFHDNYIHDYDNWDTTPVNGQTPYHHDGVHAYGSSSSNTSNGNRFDIYNNRFLSNCGASMTAHIYLEGNATSKWTQTGSARIFNNVMACESLVSNQLNLNYGTNVQVYNNTITGPGTTGQCAILTNMTTVKFKNNAISGCSVLMAVSGTTTFSNASTDINYNLYRCNSSSLCFSYFGSFKTTLAAWQSATGGEGNSTDQLTASFLLDTSYKPTVGSPLIDAAVDLSSLAITPLNSDLLSNTRIGGTWDIGAYEYGASAASAVPAVPTGLQIVGPTNATHAILIWAPNTESNLAGYRVRQSTESGSQGVVVATITAASAAASRSSMTQFSFQRAQACDCYFTVSAFNTDSIESARSSEVHRSLTGLSRSARQ